MMYRDLYAKAKEMLKELKSFLVNTNALNQYTGWIKTTAIFFPLMIKYYLL